MISEPIQLASERLTEWATQAGQPVTRVEEAVGSG